MSDVSRREMLGILAAVPVAAALDTTPEAVQRAARHAVQAGTGGAAYEVRSFTPHEWRTLRILADLVIPRDARSGSATDAGVPEFIDFMLTEHEGMRTPLKGGLRWIDTESRHRFDGAAFADLAPERQAAILDDIAWPARARPEMSHGVEFFNRFRDLVASGFYSSKLGMQDVRYMGNTVVPVWRGCPDEALRSLGVRYEDGE